MDSPSLAPGGIQVWPESLELCLLIGPAHSPCLNIENPRQAALLIKSELASGGLLLPPKWPPEDKFCVEQGHHLQIWIDER